MHEREIGPKWLFQEVFLVVDDNLAFVALDDRANSCCCQLLRDRSLRREFFR